MIPSLLTHASTAAAATAAPDPVLVAGGAFAVGLLVGLLCVGMILAVVRRVLAAARWLAVFALSATIVLAIAGGFAAAAYALVIGA